MKVHNCAYPPDCNACAAYSVHATTARRRWLSGLKPNVRRAVAGGGRIDQVAQQFGMTMATVRELSAN